jgi:hypothetical protein
LESCNRQWNFFCFITNFWKLKMSDPTGTANNVANAVQFVAGQIAKASPNPMAQAMVAVAFGEAGAVASIANAFDKIQSGTATGHDIADAIIDIAGISVGIAVLAGAPPILIGAVGVASFVNFASKNYPAISNFYDDIENGFRRGIQNAIDRGLIDPRTMLPRPGIAVNDRWREARTPIRRDPLAIDLDGDGIETVGIPTTGIPILFDHDADGVKTGTGWLKGDDAWLVLDRDGNGTIDSGRELFGVDTLISKYTVGGVPTQYIGNATDGFSALRDLDVGNGVSAPGPGGYDGIFDAKDVAFSQVRLWRDLNQDGISQANELSSLASAGITAINLTPTASTTNLGYGNSVTGTASVVRNGGNAVVSGVNLSASNLELPSNGFYRQFPAIPVTDAARALPEMGGSGWLRDLREARTKGMPPLRLQPDAREALGAALSSSSL